MKRQKTVYEAAIDHGFSRRDQNNHSQAPEYLDTYGSEIPGLKVAKDE